MTLETWLAFLLAAGANVLTPGPAIALAIRNSLAEGLGRTFYSTFGNVTAIGLVGAGVSLGLGALVLARPEILTGLRLVGGGYLVWLAIRAWRGGALRLPGGDTGLDLLSGPQLYMQSMMVGLTNPKMLSFLIALFPLFLDPGRAMGGQLALMTLTFMSLSFMTLTSFAMAAGHCARLIRQDRVLRAVNRVIAVIFLSFGLGLVWAGLDQIQDALFQQGKLMGF